MGVKKMNCMIALLLAITLLFGCGFNGKDGPASETISKDVPYTLSDDDLPVDMEKGLRIQTQKVTFSPSESKYLLEGFEDSLQNQELVQITYGFYSQGQWYDFPCEYYDLVSIFNPRDVETKEYVIKYGADTAYTNHMVKIGPYILISIDITDDADELENWIITDSLGSEPQLMFSENYVTRNTDNPYIPKDGYALCISKSKGPYSQGEDDYLISNVFHMRYYVILEYAALPEDYVFTLTRRFESRDVTYTLRYDHIVDLVAKAKNGGQ